MSDAEKCDVCGEVLHWSPLVEGLPTMSTVSDCGHVCTLCDIKPNIPQDLQLWYEVACDGIEFKPGHTAIKTLIERIARLEGELAAKDGEIERLKAANELDRRSLWAVVRAIDDEITGRMWLLEGRGCYEWDDDRYRQEFGWAVHALQEKLEPLRKIAHDLTNCPETEKGVDSVRKLEAQLAQAQQRVRELEWKLGIV